MNLFKAIREAWRLTRRQKQLEKLTSQGLDMDALKQIAKLNEKYIEVMLPDGGYIRIWREADYVRERPPAEVW